MVRNRLSKTAVLAAGIAISTCAATRTEAQGVSPPAPVAASSASSIAAVPVIVVGAGVLSVIGYAIYISRTQCRELTSSEARMAIFLPFIGPILLELPKPPDPGQYVAYDPSAPPPLQDPLATTMCWQTPPPKQSATRKHKTTAHKTTVKPRHIRSEK
jgi:hypothetical protein